MSEINVNKCEFYNDYHKTCSNFSRCSDDEPYCDPKNFKCSYYINNIEKQLEQLESANQQLRAQIGRGLSKFLDEDFKKGLVINEFKQCINEIEHIIDQYGNNGIELSVEKQEQILQLIKQALGDTHGLYCN